MSDCCQDNSIPVGPQGPAGEPGPSGTNGEDGTNGTNGIYILDSYNNNTGVSTPNSTVETILYRYDILGGEWATNGDEIELYAYLEYSANLMIDINFKLGGLTIYTYTQQNADDERMIFKIKMSRMSTASQLWTIEKLAYELETPAISVSNCLIVKEVSAADDTITNTFLITGKNRGMGANQLTLYKATLYKGAI